MEKAAAAAMEHEVVAVTAGKTKSLQGGLCWQVLRKESSLYMYWAGDVRYGGLGACGMGLRPLGYTASQPAPPVCSLHGMENLTGPIEINGTTQPVTPYRVTWHAVPCCVRRVIVIVIALLLLNGGAAVGCRGHRRSEARRSAHSISNKHGDDLALIRAVAPLPSVGVTPSS